MKLLNIALNNKIHKISIVLCVSVFVICFGLYSIHKGFDLGYSIANNECKNKEIETTIANHGASTYEYLASKYFYIVWFITIFFISKIVKRNTISHLVCLLSLGLILYQFLWIFSEKSLRAGSMFWNEAYDNLLRNAVLFDWISAIIVISLIALEFISIAFNFFNRRSAVRSGDRIG